MNFNELLETAKDNLIIFDSFVKAESVLKNHGNIVLDVLTIERFMTNFISLKITSQSSIGLLIMFSEVLTSTQENTESLLQLWRLRKKESKSTDK